MYFESKVFGIQKKTKVSAMHQAYTANLMYKGESSLRFRKSEATAKLSEVAVSEGQAPTTSAAKSLRSTGSKNINIANHVGANSLQRLRSSLSKQGIKANFSLNGEAVYEDKVEGKKTRPASGLPQIKRLTSTSKRYSRPQSSKPNPK